jgi:hypothetical protein
MSSVVYIICIVVVESAVVSEVVFSFVENVQFFL